MKTIKTIMFKTTPLLYIYLLCYVAYAFFCIQFSNIIGKSIDVASENMQEFVSYSIVLCLFTLGMFISFIGYKLIKNNYFKRVFFTLKKKLFNCIQDKDFLEYTKYSEKEYIGMLVNNIKIIEEQYITPYFLIIESVIMLMLAVMILVSINIGCAIFVIVISFVPVIIPMFFMSKLQNKMNEYAMSNAAFLEKTTEQIKGYETFKNYGAIKYATNVFKKSNSELGEKKKNAFMFMDLIMNLLAVASNFMLIGILIFGMYMALNNKISVGQVFALMFISGTVVAPINDISQNLPQIFSSKCVIDNYEEYTKSNAKYHKGIRIKDFNDIGLCNYSLCLEERPILNCINMSFEKGKKYALVGESGSGKSTIIRSLLGYYDNYTGDVCYDQYNQKDIVLSDIYREITYVPQNTIIFNGTLRENLTMFDNDRYSDSVLYEVLELVNLLDCVKKLEKGLDSIISDNQNDFSGGEKQRLAIARALLKGKKIFILDEATSALDYKNYLIVEEILFRIKGSTVISVTHRYDKKVLKNYDKIYVLKEGGLVEEGNFNHLISNKGYFSTLYYTQKFE